MAMAIVWIVGTWLPWEQTTARFAAAGFHFPSTGSSSATKSCCVAFRNTSMPTNVRQGLIMGLLVVAVIAIAFLFPRKVAGIALIGTGVLYLSDSLTWLFDISQSNLNPIGFGYPASVITQGRLTITVTALPGGWIALGAAVGLVLLGVFRLLIDTNRPTPGRSAGTCLLRPHLPRRSPRSRKDHLPVGTSIER